MISSNNTYKNSDRKRYGGFLYISGKDMNNEETVFFDENSSYSEGISLGGGAIYCSMCNIISIISCNFSSNIAVDGGSVAIAFDLAYEEATSYFDLINSTFTDIWAI